MKPTRDSTSILWGFDSGLVLKTFIDHMGNMIFIEIIPTNNNIFVIERIKSTHKMWEIHNGKCFQTHVVHEYKIIILLFLPVSNDFDTG